jgi:hypothetical protein
VALGDCVASQRCLSLLEVAPPRWLGGLRLRQSLQEDCARLRRSFVRGIVLTPWGSQRATLVERVIELPYLMVGSCGALWESSIMDTD